MGDIKAHDVSIRIAHIQSLVGTMVDTRGKWLQSRPITSQFVVTRTRS
jgi:hypothetical protein